MVFQNKVNSRKLFTDRGFYLGERSGRCRSSESDLGIATPWDFVGGSVSCTTKARCVPCRSKPEPTIVFASALIAVHSSRIQPSKPVIPRSLRNAPKYTIFDSGVHIIATGGPTPLVPMTTEPS